MEDMEESNSLQLQIHGVDGQQLSLSVDPELSGAELLKLVRQQLPSKQGLGLWLFYQNLPLRRRETLRQQLGSTNSPRTLNYLWALPKFQEAWNLLLAGATEVEGALEGMRSLALTPGSIQYLDNVELPCSLEELSLPTLQGLILPKNLQALMFGDEFNENLTGVPLPETLGVLRFGNHFDQSLERLCLPSSLLSLSFGDCFNQSLQHVKLPSALQSITFGSDFNQSLEGVMFPKSLHTLVFGKSFNQPLEGIDLPDELETLILQDDFNQHVRTVQWPSKLMVLSFGDSFHGSIDAEGLPKSLECLTFGKLFWNLTGKLPENLVTLVLGEYFPRLKRKQLPGGLRNLTLGSQAVESLAQNGINWPLTLERLTFGDLVDKQLANVMFLDSVYNITFGQRFNQSLFFVTLPSSLLTVTFGDDFNRSLENVALPVNLKSIEFGRRFNQSLERVIFPAALQTLKFGSFFQSATAVGQTSQWPSDLELWTFLQQDLGRCMAT